MSLCEIVKSWPKTWATCPVYRKGVTTPSGGTSEGKQPLGRAHKNDLAPAASLHYCEQHPDTYGAIGVFTGARSGGLLILDVDMQLANLKRKYPGDFDGPRVISPKENAGKFLFLLPEEDWAHVSDVSLVASNEGWEALWGRMGVLCGAYHAGGEYELKGEIEDIPEAPAWLVARMRLRKEEKDQVSASKAKKNIFDPYRSRPREVRHAIVQECLNVIPTQGRGSNDFWWSIGAMIHSADLGDDGLDLWRDWSKKDDDFADLWAEGSKDHCAERWDAGFNGGGLGMGSLITLADQSDPKRTRFLKNGLANEVAECEAATVRFTETWLTGEEVLSKAKELEESIENPALLDQAKFLLAKQAGRNDTSAIDRLLDADLSYSRTGGRGPVDVDELDATGFEYLIPGLLPKPWTLLVHADGGTGKTAMCQTIAKHINRGLPFNMHGGLVHVPAGRVLWLNGDQNERILRRQFKMIDAGSGIKVMGEWDMSWYRRFCKYQKAGKYDLVVIDSLDGCNDSNPYEENRREFALPIKRLARRNGVDFPACSIIIIHHNTKEGKFRGTSAIRAAVDETWNMRKVSLDELMSLSLPINTRMVTVEKSRDDREGQQMVFSLLPDYTYKIGPVPETDNTVKFDTPNQHTLDLLAVMRSDHKPYCIKDLVEHDEVGGQHRKRAIEYGLERLEQQALVERCDAPVEKTGRGRRPVYYRATGTNVPGKFVKSGVRSIHRKTTGEIENPSTGTDLNFPVEFGKIDDRKNKPGSTATGACTTETTGAIIPVDDFSENDRKNENPSTGTDLNNPVDPWVNKQIDQARWD